MEERLYPADVITGPAWSEPKEVRPGGTIEVFYNLHTKRDCPKFFKSWITNGFITTFDEQPGIEKGVTEDRVLSYKVRLPRLIEYGTHVYHVQGIWSCNPLVNQVIDYPVITFEVIK